MGPRGIVNEPLASAMVASPSCSVGSTRIHYLITHTCAHVARTKEVDMDKMYWLRCRRTGY